MSRSSIPTSRGVWIRRRSSRARGTRPLPGWSFAAARWVSASPDAWSGISRAGCADDERDDHTSAGVRRAGRRGRTMTAAAAKPAILALADGTVFHGTAFGADGETGGEVVFNTAMTGYQEILTDPSYSAQLVAMTYPEIGIAGIDTRALVRHLRTHGAQEGVISSVDLDPKRVVAKAKARPGLVGVDLVKAVTCDAAYEWDDPLWELSSDTIRATGAASARAASPVAGAAVAGAADAAV